MMKRFTLVAALTAATLAPAAAAGLPVYPGARPIYLPNSHVVTVTDTICGSKATMAAYFVSASPQTVAQWYADRMPGAIRVSPEAGAFDLFQPDGRASAIVAATPSGRVVLRTITYDPPLSAAHLNLVRAASHDASARATLKAQCGDRSS